MSFPAHVREPDEYTTDAETGALTSVTWHNLPPDRRYEVKIRDNAMPVIVFTEAK